MFQGNISNSQARARRGRRGLAATLLALLVLTGCGVVRETSRLPARTVRAVTPSSGQLTPDPAALQTALQRFVDEFISRTSAALEEYARRVGTPEARRQGLTWKLPVVSAAVGIASGPNPSANLLDLITLATVTHLAVEEISAREGKPAALQPWLEVSGSLETNAWSLAVGVLQPAQQQELQTTIQRWWDAHTDARSAFFARPQEFSSLIQETGERAPRSSGSVFGLVGLDPTAGLDPAVREVTRTRLFAERTLFTAQRMPFLLRWQAELLSDQILGQTQITEALTNAARLAESAERLSHAAESASRTAAQLPDRVTAERKAILAALEVQEGRLRELAVDLSRTLAAGEKMSDSLNTTFLTFDALMKRFGVGEPGRSTAPASKATPFNILDYERTAAQLAVTAQELSELLRETGTTLDSPALDRRLLELSTVAERAKADAKSVLNHAFFLGAGLVLLTFASALAYRWLAPRVGG